MKNIRRNLSSLMRFGLSAENTLCHILIPYDLYSNRINIRLPRQVSRCHYISVDPEKIQEPYFVCVSKSCLELIGIDISEANSDLFKSAFSGNFLLPGLDRPYATLYGCHSYGTWFGQLGDGRALSLGEVISPVDRKRYEIQLKGSGKTPFSRGFDGKAVLRSSIREFLASEAMYHLSVPTTRALCIIGTGEGITRAWYLDTAEDRQMSNPVDPNQTFGYPPDTRFLEEGAILTRISESFLRFGQLDIFGKRSELSELKQLIDYAIWREFPELLNQFPDPLTRYVEFLRVTMKRNVELVCHWIRVGYVQGNMNSDNMMLAGRTLDYGPFGWMERYDPYYQPFTSDQAKSYCFSNQMKALQVNLTTLSESIESLIKFIEGPETKKDRLLSRVTSIVSEEFEILSRQELAAMRKKKLGLSSSEQEESVDNLWTRLEKLLIESHVDYTIFFRLLSAVVTKNLSSDEMLRASVYGKTLANSSALHVEWNEWFSDYLMKVSSPTETAQMMNTVNPKNWMSTMAYERAQQGDYTLVVELSELLSSPYDEGTLSQHDKWFIRTPSWAQDMPGVAFMSCSS